VTVAEAAASVDKVIDEAAATGPQRMTKDGSAKVVAELIEEL
jgi:hypothetical protein